MIKETAVEEEPPPEEAPASEPSVDIGTNLTGPGGPDGFNIGGAKGGGARAAGGIGGGSRSRWGWYAGQVQKTIAEAVRKNPQLRKAVLSAQVRIWADSSGRVTKVTLAKSTGDPAMDEILTTQTLRGLRLAEAPPQGMPMPITLKLTARRPE